ncbi:Endo-type membrane-bound lytic murein transglycosylase A [Methylobacterium crusticola]|uniref:Endo-type membrane-bound lytic murein transglycosylase A n=2 Tax=Methylobacterium crusticola TaxID=1697972 RepID=A0ABQ4QVV9_9HYPH|nr:transglycosylase SLT domain-containing protein [Methylobacterium crusticola]GJD48786.1 Endo-type membrane-bound lytic murein transglycosylase A [Methylobacterium crusticola]
MHKRLLLAVAAVAAPLPALALESPARDNIDALIEAHAKANGVPASFIHRVVKRESGYNPRAVGRGGALGLMQIKHGTARALGYGGPASGLLDAKVNLTYGVAYLAGAYKTARGNETQAYSYYARGYYYAAKRAGIRSDVAELEAPPAPAPANPLGRFFSSVFGPRPTATAATASADPSVATLSNAIAPPGAAPQAAAPQAAPSAAPQTAAAEPAAAPAVSAPLPPTRPASLAAAPVMAYAGAAPVAGLPIPTYGQQASLAATAPPTLAAPPAPGSAGAGAPTAAAPAAAASATAAGAAEEAADAVSVPLPPRRPAEFRHFALRKPAPALPKTAAALPEPTTGPVSQ